MKVDLCKEKIAMTTMIHSTIKASCWCSISTKQKQQMNKRNRLNLHYNNTILKFSYKDLDNNATHSQK